MSRERARILGCRIVGTMLVGFLSVLIPAWPAYAAGDVHLPGETVADNLYLEPIEGLTTARHLAPRQTAIPLGTQLDLFLLAPVDAEVSLAGAIVVGRNTDGVSAVCPLNQVGPVTIRGVVQMPDGTTQTSTCKLNVVAIPISEIAVSVATPSVASFDLDENATNEETMASYFGESIAALRPVAAWGAESETGDAAPRRRRGQASTARYRTSIDRTIQMVADVNYAEFGPLMEWRVNGAAFALGSETDRAFYHTGTHSVEVGPPAKPAQLKFETYSVSIVSHTTGVDIIAEDEWVTFEAVTDPPGYEDDIRWLSSTKYGTAASVIGHGPTFSVWFENAWDFDNNERYSEWLGVRADNSVVSQDLKSILLEPDPPPPAPPDGYCEYQFVSTANPAACANAGAPGGGHTFCVLECSPLNAMACDAQGAASKFQIVSTNCVFNASSFGDICTDCSLPPNPSGAAITKWVLAP